MGNQDLKISIITASYNSGRTIEQTILSVINQTYNNIEYIIIDGDSKDETMNIVNKYKEGISTIVSENDKGIYDAFNKGCKLSTGEYVLFVNSDDYLHDANVIADMVDFVENQDDPIAVYGSLYLINEKTGWSHKIARKFEYSDLQRGLMPPHPSFLCKRKILEEFGFFKLDYKIASDFDLIFSIYKKYGDRIYYNNRVTSFFRIGGLSSHISTIHRTYEELKDILLKNDCDAPTVGKKVEKEDYLKRWLESQLFDQKGISYSLVNETVHKVAIFGTSDLALLMYKDLLNHGIETVIFLDNDSSRYHIEMNGVEVCAPSWLTDHVQEIDAIMLVFEGNHEEVVTKQIKELTNDREIKVISWRDLIHRL
ncbi:glycosyltransferase family 2 protein [Paenibacillus qinlingensis]|uniref:Glycosyltransferase involved in cell wall biosynthesis n=1 Tax=Paenibacillus qinlingensis TaxID=1837343 RepID=A0ABU1P201_9BACL|nr:glycosyltransferase family 2 protein [Paenibacillus qinlingensis]MDR6553589.1 glycosyltransferase involved in cell wall biosynthesis [Paenibacillus qinlingensis]